MSIKKKEKKSTIIKKPEMVVVEDFKTKKVEQQESIITRAKVCLSNLNNVLRYTSIIELSGITEEKLNKYVSSILKAVESGSMSDDTEKRIQTVDYSVRELNLDVLKVMTNKGFNDNPYRIEILSYLLTTGMLNSRTSEIVRKQLGIKN